MQLTILMPCLNEAETIATCIKKAQQWIKRKKIKAEILIADNGSTDNSVSIAQNLGARVIKVKSLGYGSAIYHGSLKAKGQWIIVGDADDSYDFSALDSFYDKLAMSFDIVIGNRFTGGIAPQAMPWKNRYLGNPLLSFIGRLFFQCQIKDFHCGLRAYTKKAFIKLDLQTTGMEFASEMIIKACLLKMKITEVSTTLNKDGRSRPPHLKPWRDGWRHLRFMLLFSPRWLFFIPGSVIFSTSLIIYIILLFGPIELNFITFDIHTLFFAQAGICIGMLATIFSFIIKMFGIREGLLPNNKLMKQINKFPILEIGLILGLLMILVGFIIALIALKQWQFFNYGPLDNHSLLRWVSISTLLILTGAQILLGALVLGFLTLTARKNN